MDEKFNALCIRAVPYRDNDIMLTLFTLEKGLVSAMVRGAKKQGAKLKFCTQLFCFAQYVVAEKSSRRTVIEATEVDSFYGISADIDKYYSALSVVEFIRGILKDEILAYDLFLLTIKALKNINEGLVSPYALLVKFFVEAIDISGYGVDFNKCGVCGHAINNRVFFDFNDCLFKCENCTDEFAVEMRFSTYTFLKNVKRLPIDQLKTDTYLKDMGAEALNQNCFNAIKFLDFYIRDKVGLNLKTNQSIIDMLKA